MLQTQLQELVYYKNAIVDNFGRGIFSGIRDFERQNSLIADGMASATDQKFLFSNNETAYVQRAATHTTTTTQKDATSSAIP